MKNLFKLGFVALALAATITACGGEGEAGDDTTMMESTDTMMMGVDTLSTDTMAVDTAATM